MASDWDEIGMDCRRGAQLLREKHPRGSVSRAYYAAFSILNQRILAYKIPPIGYETHPHRSLPDLIEEHLLAGDARRRRSLRTTIRRLYNARLVADYRLARTVDETVALNALRDAKMIFEMLGVSDG